MKKVGWSLILIAAVLLNVAVKTHAQQPTKVPRIGYLSVSSPSAMSTRTEAFRQGLRELGYVEGKNIVIEWRSAEGKRDRLSSLAAELVRLKVDIIVTAGPPATRSADVPAGPRLVEFPKTATRESRGTISFRSSSRFPLRWIFGAVMRGEPN